MGLTMTCAAIAKIASKPKTSRGTTMYIAFDIETVRNTLAKSYYMENYTPSLGNFSQRKDESDEAWAIRSEALMNVKREAAMEKAGLHWWTGKVISVAYRYIHSPEPATCIYSEEEEEVLMDFGKFLESQGDVQLVGKNSDTFDVPFLIGRYMAHDMGVPNGLFKGSNHIHDVDHIFHRSSVCSQRGKLSDYAWGLGLDGKIGSGNMVQDWYDAEYGPDWEIISKYNCQDTEIVAEMFRRYRPFGVRH